MWRKDERVITRSKQNDVLFTAHSLLTDSYNYFGALQTHDERAGTNILHTFKSCFFFFKSSDWRRLAGEVSKRANITAIHEQYELH